MIISDFHNDTLQSPPSSAFLSWNPLATPSPIIASLTSLHFQPDFHRRQHFSRWLPTLSFPSRCCNPAATSSIMISITYFFPGTLLAATHSRFRACTWGQTHDRKQTQWVSSIIHVSIILHPNQEKIKKRRIELLRKPPNTRTKWQFFIFFILLFGYLTGFLFTFFRFLSSTFQPSTTHVNEWAWTAYVSCRTEG